MGVGMSLSLSETLQEVQDVASTLVRATPTGLTSGETMFNPASWHGHQGGNDMFILTNPGLDFQLFRSANDLTFITGHGDTASYWGGGNQTIYNSGTDTTLRCASPSWRISRSTSTASMRPHMWISIMRRTPQSHRTAKVAL